MTSGDETTAPRPPRVRNPAAEPDHSPDKQSELKLNVGIGVLGTILSLGTVVIFLFALEEPSYALAGLMAVVTVVSAGVTLYAAARKRRARPTEAAS